MGDYLRRYWKAYVGAAALALGAGYWGMQHPSNDAMRKGLQERRDTAYAYPEPFLSNALRGASARLYKEGHRDLEDLLTIEEQHPEEYRALKPYLENIRKNTVRRIESESQLLDRIAKTLYTKEGERFDLGSDVNSWPYSLRETEDLFWNGEEGRAHLEERYIGGKNWNEIRAVILRAWTEESLIKSFGEEEGKHLYDLIKKSATLDEAKEAYYKLGFCTPESK